MALRKRGKYRVGDTQEDIRPELLHYSKGVKYPIHHYADAVCTCGGKQFTLELDENVGAAVRTCVACENEHLIGDSAEYIAEADLEERECICGGEVFEITAGVSLYQDSEDVRWFYLGCRCVACGVLGCYGDWKNEFNGYQQLLMNV